MARQYRYEVIVKLWDEHSGRLEPCVISTVNGDIETPDDPRGLLTAKALQDASEKAAFLSRQWGSKS